MSEARIRLAIDKKREAQYIEKLYEQFLADQKEEQEDSFTAGLAGQILGGLVGFAFGGTAGAKLGSSIGSSAFGYSKSYDDYDKAREYVKDLKNKDLKFSSNASAFEDRLDADLSQIKEQAKNLNQSYVVDTLYSLATTDYDSFEPGSATLGSIFGSSSELSRDLKDMGYGYSPIRMIPSYVRDLASDAMTTGSATQRLMTDFAESQALKTAARSGNLDKFIGNLLGEKMFKQFKSVKN
tara:strand:+ start:8586 stop:9302 length:717 start_codon:yes stop_codon:yes gene_type:complete